MPRKDCEAVPEGNCPIPQQEEFGSGEPTLADIYRFCEEKFDRMDSYSDRWNRKLSVSMIGGVGIRRFCSRVGYQNDPFRA